MKSRTLIHRILDHVGDHDVLIAALAGCGKTRFIHDNTVRIFHMVLMPEWPQDAQKGSPSHPPDPGAPRRAGVGRVRKATFSASY